MTVRENIHAVLNQSKKRQSISYIYDSLMVITIMASIAPLMFYKEYPIFALTEKISVAIFIVDYILRWMTADIESPHKRFAILKYPLTAFAIIDLLSILPGINAMNQTLKTMKIIRFLKIIRVLKFIKYSGKIQMLLNVLRKEQQILSSVFILAVFYIFFTALLVYNVEPRINPITGEVTFNSFFDALYWATITLTTVGYGDIVPITNFGRLVSMFSALFGLAIIALPSGIITASYLNELREKKNNATPDDKNQRRGILHKIKDTTH